MSATRAAVATLVAFGLGLLPATTAQAFNGLLFPSIENALPRAPAPNVAPLPAPSPAPDNAWDAGTTVLAPDGRELTPDMAPAAIPHGILGLADKRATLEAIRYALTEVADGATYVWRRQAGPLRGIVRPTASFRDEDGRICRHIVLGVAIGIIRRKIEGIACRGPDGRWALSG